MTLSKRRWAFNAARLLLAISLGSLGCGGSNGAAGADAGPADADAGGGGGGGGGERDAMAGMDAAAADASANDGGGGSQVMGTGTLTVHLGASSTFPAGSYTLDETTTSSLIYGQANKTSVAGVLTRLDIPLDVTTVFAATCNGQEDVMNAAAHWVYQVNTTSSERSHNPGRAGDLVPDAPAGKLVLIRNGARYSYEVQLQVAAARVSSYTSHEQQDVPCGGGGMSTTIHDGAIGQNNSSESTCGGAPNTSMETVERGAGPPEFGFMISSGDFNADLGTIDLSMDGMNTDCSVTYCLPGGTSKVSSDLGTCHNTYSGHVVLPFEKRWLE